MCVEKEGKYITFFQANGIKEKKPAVMSIRREPLVSIVIPVYNVEKYLRQCLDSVIMQTYRSLEILIIDDGSTDTSGEICDEYGAIDNRVKVFHTENRGLSASRNIGLDNASGEYIAFIDSDDWYDEDAIYMSIEVAEKSNADIVCFQYAREYDDVSNVQKINRHKEGHRKPIITEYTEESILEEYCFGSSIKEVSWNKIYKKFIFSDIRYPEERFYEDIVTTHKLLRKAKKVTCVSSALIHYRAREESISMNHHLKNFQDNWWANRKRFEELTNISAKYSRSQLKPCMRSIGRMWRWYAGLSNHEQWIAKETLDSMQQFAATHRKEWMTDPQTTYLDRFLCLCTVTTNTSIMRTLYVINQMYRLFCIKAKPFKT